VSDGVDLDVVARRLLWSLPTGLFVLGSAGTSDAGPWNLMTINQVVQVSTAPRVVVLGIERGSMTASLLDESSAAALSLLRRRDAAIVRRFVRPVSEMTLDKEGRPSSMAGHEVELLANSAPVLKVAVGWLELRVVDQRRFDSHVAYFAEVAKAAAEPELLEGPASARGVEILRMEDTKMNYGG